MTGVEAREIVESAVRRELFGPTDDRYLGRPIDCSSGVVRFETKEDSWGVFHDSESGEEVLTQSDPVRRYGIGILHGGESSYSSPENESDSSEDIVGFGGNWSGADEEFVAPQTTVSSSTLGTSAESDSDDFDLSDANSFKPAAMGISFRCTPNTEGSLEITVNAAYYDKIEARIPGLEKARTWWVRRPIQIKGSIPAARLSATEPRMTEVPLHSADGSEPRLKPAARIFTRPVPNDVDGESRIVTLAVVNPSEVRGPVNALLQTSFEVRANGNLSIDPYPESSIKNLDAEEESLALLYRNLRTFAIGHGCAADWERTGPDSAKSVSANPLPSFEVPSLTPDVYKKTKDGKREAVSVNMSALAQGDTAGDAQVAQVLDLYDDWIIKQKAKIPDLAERFQDAANLHISKCREAYDRMVDGWALVNENAEVGLAFRLANEAMAIQQQRSRLDDRAAIADDKGVFRIEGAHPSVELSTINNAWRPFQIAFILASIRGIADPTHESRSTVELIFFPTGGGKTEAYLGAAAMSILLRRIQDPNDSGTDVLMRYTLRLLTAQQFLRAASLICALEEIRLNDEDRFGSERISIGIWLGGASTPNSWKQAVDNLNALKRDRYTENKFLLLRCPWCGAQMGTTDLPSAGKSKPKGQAVLGYERNGKHVNLRCIDNQCKFSSRAGLPVHVVDEDIYETRPTVVIGTVDKFAMLAWKTDASSIFGYGEGQREHSPPSLIIQDELHLISGPLGSMVGLYEPVIQELCTDERTDSKVLPKIIASTATIRRYEDQVKALYGRDSVALFPPHGLEEGSSFFAEPATDDDGKAKPGRRYVGIMSASLGSTQSVQVRVAASSLLAAAEVPEEDRDGYWTNLNFLNSLRELGNTVSLLQADVPDYLTGLRKRDGLEQMRWPREVLELTSRIRNDKIPESIRQLQRGMDANDCVDICLASNIIEVGVDIDRLALMTIVGQPKTTSQYIQVSGRVGRKPDRSPGLVLTIYGAARPRDRSHYERFRTYHERLYAQVEPTSVTPFAKPVLERALHAALVARMRQRSPGLMPHPFPKEDFDHALEVILERAALVDPDELSSVRKKAAALEREWSSWLRTEWDANPLTGDPKQGLMRYAGSLPDLQEKGVIWDVPSSMRNVDAECQMQVSLAYQIEAGSATGDEYE